MKHHLRLSWFAGGVLAILTGCTGFSSGGAPAPLAGRQLTRGEFIAAGGGGNIWPLSVESGTLSCVELEGQGERQDFAVVFTTDNGAQYALNGTAENTGRYQPGRQIYAPGVYSPSPKPDATSLIGYGLKL